MVSFILNLISSRERGACIKMIRRYISNEKYRTHNFTNFLVINDAFAYFGWGVYELTIAKHFII